jgi:hypothetical protein
MNMNNVNDSLRSSFAQFLETRQVSVEQSKGTFAAFTPEDVTSEKINTEVKTLLMGGHRNSFGSIPGMADARGDFLDAELADDGDAVAMAHQAMVSLIRDTLTTSIANRENADAAYNAAGGKFASDLTVAARAVLHHGVVVDTAGLDDEFGRMLGSALIAQADWTEPSETAKANLVAQLAMGGSLETALRSSRVNWVFQLANAGRGEFARPGDFERSMR